MSGWMEAATDGFPPLLPELAEGKHSFNLAGMVHDPGNVQSCSLLRGCVLRVMPGRPARMEAPVF